MRQSAMKMRLANQALIVLPDGVLPLFQGALAHRVEDLLALSEVARLFLRDLYVSVLGTASPALALLLRGALASHLLLELLSHGAQGFYGLALRALRGAALPLGELT